MPPDRKVIANIPRLNQYMDANGLEAIAVRSGVNFTYLAGMALPGTLARHLDLANTVRGFMLLWPRKGEPVIVLDSFAEKVALRNSWVPRVAIYHAYVESLYTRVAKILEDLGLGTARVGFEGWPECDALGRNPVGLAAPRDGRLLTHDGRGPVDQDAGGN